MDPNLCDDRVQCQKQRRAAHHLRELRDERQRECESHIGSVSVGDHQARDPRASVDREGNQVAGPRRERRFARAGKELCEDRNSGDGGENNSRQLEKSDARGETRGARGERQKEKEQRCAGDEKASASASRHDPQRKLVQRSRTDQRTVGEFRQGPRKCDVETFAVAIIEPRNRFQHRLTPQASR